MLKDAKETEIMPPFFVLLATSSHLTDMIGKLTVAANEYVMSSTFTLADLMVKALQDCLSISTSDLLRQI
jgi:hypothetical protein